MSLCNMTWFLKYVPFACAIWIKNTSQGKLLNIGQLKKCVFLAATKPTSIRSCPLSFSWCMRVLRAQQRKNHCGHSNLRLRHCYEQTAAAATGPGALHPAPKLCPSSKVLGYAAVVQINSLVSAEEHSLVEGDREVQLLIKARHSYTADIHLYSAVIHQACMPAHKLSANEKAKMWIKVKLTITSK